MVNGWIGVDLDGTLAYYEDWVSIEDIGAPIQPMVDRVKQWLKEGKRVKIFTARVHPTVGRDLEQTVKCIESWCMKYIGTVLPITCQKDFKMIELWDDRCVKVEKNTGKILSGE